MKILITSNDHLHYNKVGEVVNRLADVYIVRIPHATGTIETSVKEGEYKAIKLQDKGL